MSENKVIQLHKLANIYLTGALLSKAAISSFYLEFSKVLCVDYLYISFGSKNSKKISPVYSYGIELNSIPLIDISDNTITNHVLKSKKFYCYPSNSNLDFNYINLIGREKPKNEYLFPIIFDNISKGIVTFGYNKRKMLQPSLLNCIQFIFNCFGAIFFHQKFIGSTINYTGLSVDLSDKHSICTNFAKNVSKTVSCDIVKIWLIVYPEEENRKIELCGHCGYNSDVEDVTSVSEEMGGVTWKSIRIGERILQSKIRHLSLTQYIKNIQSDSKRYLNQPFSKKYNLASLLCMPIIYKEEVLGCINFYTKRKYNFSSLEVKHIISVGYYLGFEIKNIERTNDIRRITNISNPGTLAIGYSHDIRNQLRKINKLFGSALYEKYDKSAREAVVASINQQIELLQNLFDVLNDLAREEAILYKKEKLKTILENAEYLLGSQLENITTKIDCDPQLTLVCDKTKILQVLLNLFNNSVYALKKSGKPKKIITISVTGYESTNTHNIKISFIDNGTGISKSNLKKIFSKVFTTKSHELGIGFGLIHCKKLIEEFHLGESFCGLYSREKDYFLVYIFGKI